MKKLNALVDMNDLSFVNTHSQYLDDCLANFPTDFIIVESEAQNKKLKLDKQPDFKVKTKRTFTAMNQNTQVFNELYVSKFTKNFDQLRAPSSVMNY